MPFLLDDVSQKERTQFEMTFYLNREKYKLNLLLDNKVIYEETLQVYSSIQPTLLYKRTYNAEKDATDIVFGGKVGLVLQQTDGYCCFRYVECGDIKAESGL